MVEIVKKQKEKDDPVLTFTANSMGEFRDLVDSITYHWRKNASERQVSEEQKPAHENKKFYSGELSPWFRGITQDDYKCEPGLICPSNIRSLGIEQQESRVKGEEIQELKVDKKKILILEKYAFKRFKQFASPLLTRLPQERIEWLFLMQHHGFTTRLLDWSKSSLMALFLAIKKYENKKKKEEEIKTRIEEAFKDKNYQDKVEARKISDAAVWILEPRELKEIITNSRAISVEAEVELLNQYIDLSQKGHQPESVDIDQAFPLPIIPELVSPRIASQMGRFTLHTHKTNGLVDFANKLYEEEGRWYLIKIIIPSENHRDFLTSIRLAGVSYMDVKQDLEGITDELLCRIRAGVEMRNDSKNM